jgi:hypothetical protein
MSKSAFKRLDATMPESRDELIRAMVRMEVRMAGLEQLPEIIPTNWLDPLLSGPNAVLPATTREITPKHIEALLLAVIKRQRERIAALRRESST